jgi:hypothetical protein
MDSGTNMSDYAREYIVETSTVNTNWTLAANGEGTGAMVTANFPIVQAQLGIVALSAQIS